MNEICNERVGAKLVTVEELLYESNSSNFNSNKLRIPEYQRPYVWAEKNVYQLLDDIWQSFCSDKKEYRIGTIILHAACPQHSTHIPDSLDVVDGQQRITTLLLLLRFLDKEVPLLKLLKYNSLESKKHIIENSVSIHNWINENLLDCREDFLKFIQEKCKFVVITVRDLSEAFQMFETQNGRGKNLEAYNLLKAYHIRAMEFNSQSERIFCDRRWEKSIRLTASTGNDLLKQVIGEQLYKSRLWLRAENPVKIFSNEEIDEFKGLSIDKNETIKYPYQNVLFFIWMNIQANNIYPINVVQSVARYSGEKNNLVSSLVSINQPIINGRLFFDYVDTYVCLYKSLFLDIAPKHDDSSCLKDFKRFYYLYCLNYQSKTNDSTLDLNTINLETYLNEDRSYCPKNAATRTGDTYLRELYKTLILVIFDKFGEEALGKYYKLLYRLVYLKRLELGQVRAETIIKILEFTQVFIVIRNAKTISDLRGLNACYSKLKDNVFDVIKKRANLNKNDTLENINVERRIYDMVMMLENPNESK